MVRYHIVPYWSVINSGLGTGSVFLVWNSWDVCRSFTYLIRLDKAFCIVRHTNPCYSVFGVSNHMVGYWQSTEVQYGARVEPTCSRQTDQFCLVSCCSNPVPPDFDAISWLGMSKMICSPCIGRECTILYQAFIAVLVFWYCIQCWYHEPWTSFILCFC